MRPVLPFSTDDVPLRRTAFFLALALIYVRFTGMHEILAMKLGFNTYILYLLALPAGVSLLMTGGLRRTLEWRPAQYWLAFALWITLAVPFSFWPGGSTQLVAVYWRTELVQLFFIAGLLLTWTEVWATMQVLALAAASSVFIGFFFRDTVLGRVKLEIGSLGDPNDFAAHLTLMSPFLLLVIFTPLRGAFFKIAAVPIAAWGVYQIVQTGSRGGFVALIITFVAMLVLFRGARRWSLLGGSIILSLIAVTTLPDRILVRLSTLVSQGNQQTELAAEAIASEQARTYLLKKSIAYTFRHPILGVGPGEFADYEGAESRRQGRRSGWNVTHNSYTQVSSEAGIPALIFFLGALITTFALLIRTRRQAEAKPPTVVNQRIALTASCLLLATIGFSTSILFLSLAYRYFMPALTALSIALYRAAQIEWAAQQTPVVTAAVPAANRFPLPPRAGSGIRSHV